MGTIELRSGKWQWQVLPGEGVRYLHLVQVDRPDNQMLRPLVSSGAIMERTVRSFAMHPGSRTWVDAAGDWWMLHDPAYLMRVRTPGPRLLTVVSAAGDQRAVQVTESLGLGELTAAELQELVGQDAGAQEEGDVDAT